MRNHWGRILRGPGRAGPGRAAGARVVHAVFYNFADGEVARHIPWVWGRPPPEEAIAVRERGSAAALRQTIGELADSPALVRVADLATRAAVSAPAEGRALYVGLRALDVPQEPVARLWHAATLLREHRGDGHDPRLGHRGEQVVARDLPHGVAEGAAAVEDDGSVEAAATADAALGQLEILHGDAVSTSLQSILPCSSLAARTCRDPSPDSVSASSGKATIGG